jgi:hypothetical protein
LTAAGRADGNRQMLRFQRACRRPMTAWREP